jgi:glycosyltransferase involved in cell wall biosynthesis
VALTLRLGLPGFRYVTTAHGILGLHSRRNAVYRVVDLAAARLASAVVTVSGHGRRDLIRAGSRDDRTVTIPNGLADRELAVLRAIAATRAADGRLDRPLRVGFLGRLSPEKGTHEVAEIARHLVASGSGATLDIAGDGPDRKRLQAELAPLVTVGAVRFRGKVADAPAWLRDIDILVMPSHNEGMPYVLLEGMAAGCAVVAFGVGGVPEVIADTDRGILIEPGDLGGLLAAVQALTADPARVAAIGRAASAHIADRFALAERLAALQRVYGLATQVAGHEAAIQ